jgi:hypothetical protein
MSANAVLAKAREGVRVCLIYTLTRMFVPKPKKAFQSPGVHSWGGVVVMACLI